jgi:salicylate synthase
VSQHVSQYRGAFDAFATYGRLRDAGVLGSHSYLHISHDHAEIGWAPIGHLRMAAHEYDPGWRKRIAAISASAADAGRKAFGYVGFDVVDGWSPTRPDGSGEAPPFLEFIVPGEVIVFSGGDRVTHQSHAELDVRPFLTMRLPAPRTAAPGVELEGDTPAARERFEAAVGKAVQGLRAGEANKVVLSRVQSYEMEYDPLTLFAALCLSRQCVDAFLISFGDVAAVVASPELLLESRQRRIVTNPLAGTRPRGATHEEDERLRAELRLDPKEILEHMLSVTTMLHQLEPLCEHDSLLVGRLMEVCVQQNVQHLSSVIRGVLCGNSHVLDALWALFPSVTIAGFPKEPALRIVRELEGAPRGLYSGVLGWSSGDSECRFSLAIRGAFRYGSRTFLHAGAGIMPESVPRSEFVETQHKLAITREALGMVAVGPEALAR